MPRPSSPLNLTCQKVLTYRWRVTGTTTQDELPDETLVYMTPLDELTEEDEPLVFAPAPKD